MQLLGSGLEAEPHHLCNAEKEAEFACVHNCDSSDFMNDDQFQHFILRKTKANEPYEWDLLDEMGTSTVEHTVENEDQDLLWSGIYMDGSAILSLESLQMLQMGKLFMLDLYV